MKKAIILSLVAAMFVASCSREETVADPSVRTADSDSPVIFTAGGCFEASVSTKTVVVDTLSQFNCIATTGTSEVPSWDQVQAVFKKSGETYTNTSCFWPTTDLSSHFYASNAALTYATTGCTVSPANADIDVVVAYKTSNKQPRVNLAFSHIFSRVGTINLSADKDGATVSNISVKLKSVVTSGTYNLKTAEWTNRGTGADATLQNSSNDLYVVPGTYALEVSYTYKLGDYTDSLTRSADVTLVEGKINSISGKLSGDAGNIVTFTVTVTPWGTKDIPVTL